MRVSVLGPLEVDGGATPLGPRDRVALAVLVLRHGTPVRSETVADVLWGDDLPASAGKVVQGCIVRLRKALGVGAIRTTESGYVLRLHHDEVDVAVFQDLVARSRRLLADGQPDRVRYLADRALELWRGEPYNDISDWPDALSEIDRLCTLRREAEELDVEARLALGLHEDAVPDLVRLVRAEPDREHRWALLALAQYRSGRQAEALSALQRARAHLVSSLGVDPGQELSALAGAVLRQDPSLDAVGTSVIDEPTCPYPGLAPFETDDAGSFFGRGDDVAAGLRRLDERGVLALVGPSGCGKSSVLRAGVAAALLADGHHVEVLTPGPHPDAVLAVHRTGTGVVLVVDQAEEVFAATAEEAQAFLLALVDHVRRGGLLALGVRADRMGEFSAHPEVARLVEDGLILLGPLTEDGLRRAIEGPAAQAGLHVEPGLVELLVQDVLGEPGALPLLSHVLRRTWEHREGRTLTVAGYRTTGGVRGAVAQSAEALFRDLLPAEREALRTLMTRLVGLDDHGDLVRQRVARETIGLDDTRHVVIGKLAGARLVSVDGDAVEISHESLAVAWPRLRSWLDDDVEGNRIMRHLAVAAATWATLARPPSELYRGVRQARAAEWADRMGPALSVVEREFLDASAALAEREEQASLVQARRERMQNRRLRAGIALVATLLVASLVAGGAALSASREARDRALVADAGRLGAEALRAAKVDTKLLLAASGVALHDDVDTRASLLAALDAAPSLTRSARITSTSKVAVDPRTGLVLVSGFNGLHVRDPDSLAEIAHHPTLPGFSVVAGSTGGGVAMVVLPNLVGMGSPALPAIALLDADGALLPDQLGGFPDGAYAFDPVSLSPDGRWLAASLNIDPSLVDDDTDLTPVLGVWDVQRPEAPVASLRLTTPAAGPAVVNGGRDLAYVSDGDLVVRSLPGGEVRHRRTAEDLRTPGLGEYLAVAPDGGTVAVAGAGDLVLVDTQSWEPVGHLPDVGDAASIAFSADGTLVGAGSDRLVVWRFGPEGPVEVLREDDGGGKIAFSRDGGAVFTTDFGGDLLTAWDLTGGKRFLAVHGSPEDGVHGLPRISPDGSRALYAESHPKPMLRVRDLTTGAVQTVIDPQQGPTSFIDSAWSPDGGVATLATGVERVSLWDTRTGAILARTELPEGEGVSTSVFSPDGGSLIVGTTLGRLHLLDARTLHILSDPVAVAPDGTEGNPAIANLEPAPDGRVLAMLAAGTFVVDPEARTADAIDVEAFGAGWSPDGERVFVTMQDGRVGVLDATTWRWLAEPTGTQPFSGWTVRYSPDGDRVVTMAGGRAGLFDAGTAEFLGSVTVGDDGTAAFAPDGESVVIAENGGQVRTWDLDPGVWIERACRMAGRNLTEQEWREYLPDREYVSACEGRGMRWPAAAQPRRAGREEVEKATAPPERRAG